MGHRSLTGRHHALERPTDGVRARSAPLSNEALFTTHESGACAPRLFGGGPRTPAAVLRQDARSEVPTGAEALVPGTDALDEAVGTESAPPSTRSAGRSISGMWGCSPRPRREPRLSVGGRRSGTASTTATLRNPGRRGTGLSESLRDDAPTVEVIVGASRHWSARKGSGTVDDRRSIKRLTTLTAPGPKVLRRDNARRSLGSPTGVVMNRRGCVPDTSLTGRGVAPSMPRGELRRGDCPGHLGCGRDDLTVAPRRRRTPASSW